MSSNDAKLLEISVAEMSGRTHQISDLTTIDTVSTLYHKAAESMNVAIRTIGLVVADDILGCADFDKALQSAGIGNGMTLLVVRLCQYEFYEYLGNVGDEDDQLGLYSNTETVVRLALTSPTTCMLIRQTYVRTSNGAFTWDICRGTYILEDDDVAVCTWSECYRRRRAGVERAGIFRINDSGWIRTTKVPDSWKQITLNGGAWTTQAVRFQEGDRILGIKLFGRGNCVEAIRLMAIA